MKIYAHYDDSGKILSVFSADGPDGAGAMLTPRPGAHFAEIEEIEGLDLKSANVDALREIAKTYTVAEPLSRCKLVKRN
jgi:hypothetical protein